MENVLERREGLTYVKHEIFNPITIIKPAPGSSKFFRQDKGQITGAVESTYGLNEFGDNVLLTSQPYNRERFAGTIQVMGAEFNYAKSQWLIIDPLDILKKRILDRNSEALNELVANCKLVNQRENHPDKGKFITSANIFDRLDPFFTHPLARLSLSGGEAYISSKNSDYLNVIILLCFIPRRKFQLGSATKAGIRGSQVKFIIVDKAIERKEKQDFRKKVDEARDKYKALDDHKKLKVVLALGVTSINLNKIDYTLIDDIAYEYATDFETKHLKTHMSKGDAFLNLLDSDSNTIEAYYAFYFGIKCSVIKNLNKAYTAFGQRLGVTISDCVRVLMSPDNNLMVDILNACEVFTNDLRKVSTPISRPGFEPVSTAISNDQVVGNINIDSNIDSDIEDNVSDVKKKNKAKIDQEISDTMIEPPNSLLK